jgi:hypothetical protein
MGVFQVAGVPPEAMAVTPLLVVGLVARSLSGGGREGVERDGGMLSGRGVGGGEVEGNGEVMRTVRQPSPGKSDSGLMFSDGRNVGVQQPRETDRGQALQGVVE